MKANTRKGLHQDRKLERGRDRLVCNVLRLLTYGMVAAVAIIFGTIVIKGSATLFHGSPGSDSHTFLTGNPETLHVYKPRETENRIQALDQRRIGLEQRRDPFASLSDREATKIDQQLTVIHEELEALQRRSREGTILLSDSTFQSVAEKPDLDRYSYENYAYSSGGIAPAITGTLLLILGAVGFALILGIPCAIYLNEWQTEGRLTRLIRLSLLTLAGVPSIVYGLFGFGIFVLQFQFGVSLLSGWLTLGLMGLPIVVVASEQALRSIPNTFREAALALGASRWTMIRSAVLPHALPGMLTASIMTIARIAGDTAALIFTAAVALRTTLPWQGLDAPSDFFLQGVMALPFHIYILGSKLPQNEHTSGVQYGSALVFLLIVGALTLASVLLRSYYNRRRLW